MSEQVVIVPSVLKEQVESGWKKKALADHYGLPMTQMTQALKQQGLTIRKFHQPKFVFAEEVVEAVAETVEVVAEEVEVSSDTMDSEAQGEVADMGFHGDGLSSEESTMTATSPVVATEPAEESTRAEW